MMHFDTEWKPYVLEQSEQDLLKKARMLLQKLRAMADEAERRGERLYVLDPIEPENTHLTDYLDTIESECHLLYTQIEDDSTADEVERRQARLILAQKNGVFDEDDDEEEEDNAFYEDDDENEDEEDEPCIEMNFIEAVGYVKKLVDEIHKYREATAGDRQVIESLQYYLENY